MIETVLSDVVSEGNMTQMRIARGLLLSLTLILTLSVAPSAIFAQKRGQDPSQESERSDKFTGGKIELTELQANQPDVKLTLNVPAFRLTLWQNGKEVKSYYVGVGRREFPLVIGERSANQIIWNPSWIPPDSDWVHAMGNVKAGEVIPASDSRNPIGKVKIPLGDSYLIHQAKPGDQGRLVSHGCIRLPLPDLYDLSSNLVIAKGLSLTEKQIERAKRSIRPLAVSFDPMQVDINYDTLVVENGMLYVYPDVYGYGTSTVKELRRELETSGVDTTDLNDVTLKSIIAKAGKGKAYVVSVDSIKSGKALEEGILQAIVPKAQPKDSRQAQHEKQKLEVRG